MKKVLWLVLCLLASLALLAGPVWAQEGIALEVLNPPIPGTLIVPVVQGELVQVSYSVRTLPVETGPLDVIQLRNTGDESVVSQQERGESLSGTVSLSTAPSNAVGDLEARYVLADGAVLATAPQIVRVSPAGPSEVTVPSAEAPTIQAAIDLVADGGTVNIGPGTYHEHLVIAGKQVHLVGSGLLGRRRTMIADALPRLVVPYQEAQGLVRFGPGGGGSISKLILQGGDAGVVGIADDSGTPAPVQITNTVIRRTGRGVLGSFSRLKIERVAISGTRWHGVSVVECADLQVLATYIANTDGVGVFVDNTGVSAGSITIAGASIWYCWQGGIVVAGDAKTVLIDNCFIGINWVAGIRLWDAGSVAVTNTTVFGVLLGQIEVNGDVYQNLAFGLIAFQSDFVSVADSTFEYCEMAGMIYDTSGGVIIDTTSGDNNRFGLVLQGEPKPDYSDPDNVFSGTEEDIITDGALSVPEAPPLP